MREHLVDFWSGVAAFIKNSVWSALTEISFIDVIDILLLSVILLYVYKFLRGRRAGKLALGLGLVALVLLLSVVFNMRAMTFILQNFYQVGILAILIIFQADLRAGLEQVGGAPIKGLKSMSTKEYKETLDLADVLAETAQSLSEDKTGALIAIERNTKLGEYLQNAVIVNSDTSSMLLRNLFFNKAPLHDGAVIIRDRRVYAAGCYLPLTEKDINKNLGTRHRAGIGLSEVSDAVVIIVSEETGRISLAVNGELTIGLSQARLKNALMQYLLPNESTVKKLTGEIRRGRRGGADGKASSGSNGGNNSEGGV